MVNDEKFKSYGHDLSLIRDDRLRELHYYWISLKTENKLPSRKQIDPLKFPNGLIGYVSLFDVIDDGEGGYRITFRIAGSISYGHNVLIRHITGRELYEVLPRNEAHLTVQDWTVAIRTRRPVAATGVSFPFQYGPQPWEAIALPLSSDAKAVDALFTARVPVVR